MIYKTLQKTTNRYPYIYRAKVEDVDDPDELGKVRVRVYPMMLNRVVTKEMLPWAVPAQPMSGGAGAAYGNFCIPRLDSFVWVFFEMGDPMQPVYMAEATDGVHGLPADRLIDYPYSVIRETKEGMKFYVDRDIIKITHKSGTTVTVDIDGNVVVDTVNNVNVTAPNSANFDCPVVSTTQNLEAGNGANGSFTAASGETIMVAKGIIVSIV